MLVVLAAAAVAFGAGTREGQPPESDSPAALPHRFAPGALGSAGVDRIRASSWWGGRYTTATGEQVNVFVSSSYPQDEAVPQRWAEFFATLVHGAELGSITVNVAPLGEVEELCGGSALGCYGAGRLVIVGDDTDGIPATSVAAHEYGHHVAGSRSNVPWRALDWGPKRWATAMGICQKTAKGAVFPGDQGARYRLNPGEAFAETYRLLNQRRADPAASSWPIVDASLYPSAEALAAAEADVARPWAAPKAVVRRHRFRRGRGSVWTLRVATPLDGDLRVTLDLPPATPYRLTLVGPSGEVLGRGLWSSAMRQVARATVCGTRAVSVRVERQGPPARVVLGTRTP